MAKKVKTACIRSLVKEKFPGSDYVAVYEPWFEVFTRNVEKCGCLKEREFISFTDPFELFNSTQIISTLYIIGPEQIVRPAVLNDFKLLKNLPIGYLSAKTVSAAVDTVKRHDAISKYDRVEDLIVDRQERGSTWKNGNRLGYPEGAIENVDTSRKLLNRDWRMIGITAHGRADVVYFPNILLCGKTLNGEWKTQTSREPACASTGTCFYPDKERLRPSQLNARIVFLNSCTSLTNGQGVFSENYSLDVEASNSCVATHLIGSPIARDGTSEQVHLVSLLLDEAISVGHAVALSEEILLLTGRERPHLLNVGDPATKFAKQPSGQIGQIESLIDAYELDIPYLGLIFTDPGLSEKSGTVLVDVKTGRSMALHTTRIGGFVLPRGAISPGLYQAKPLNIFQIVTKIEKALAKPIENYRHIKKVGIHPEKYEGRMKDLESELHRAEDYLKYAQASGIGKLWKTIERLDTKMKTLDTSIHEDLIQRTVRSPITLSETYRQGCERLTTKLVEKPCQVCGGTVTKTEWEHFLHKQFSRVNFDCSACGASADVPGALVRDSDVYPGSLLVDTNNVQKGAEAHVQISISPTLGLSQGLVSVQLMDTNRFVTESAISKASWPNNRQTLTMALRIPNAIPSHHFWVRAYVVKNGTICSFTSNIWIP